jgi:hypothetical protein
MASYRATKSGSKKWIARRSRDWKEHFLGYYATEEEAVAAEHAFDIENPASPLGRMPQQHPDSRAPRQDVAD